MSEYCETCRRCEGSGEIAISIYFPMSYVGPGPVPDYARRVCARPCDGCGGRGKVPPDSYFASEGCVKMNNLIFKRESYGATVATVYEDAEQIVEVQQRNDGTFGLIIHRRHANSDQWDDLTAYLKPEHFAALGTVGCAHPLRLCGYCKAWHSKPCGEGCQWQSDDPTAITALDDARKEPK